MATTFDVSCKTSQVTKYTFTPSSGTDFFSFSAPEQSLLLQKVNEKFSELEASRPAAGYKLILVGSNRGKNLLEVTLEAYDSRPKESEMEMPKMDPCAFCAKVEKNEQKQGFEAESSQQVRVIHTLQDNPLIVAASHQQHWFKMSLMAQMQAVSQAFKIIRHLKGEGESYNYELKTHIGSKGHQNVPHSHMHILIGSNVALGSRLQVAHATHREKDHQY